MEDEFQALSSEVQRTLAELIHASEHEDPPTKDRKLGQKDLCKQFNRCHSVYRQMKVEVQGDIQFKERLGFYKIQLDTLQTEFDDYLLHLRQQQQQQQNQQLDTDDVHMLEITFCTWREEPQGKHLMLESSRDAA